MVYQVYELSAYLNNLILSSDIDNKIEWVGKKEDWDKMEKEITDYEEAINDVNK